MTVKSNKDKDNSEYLPEDKEQAMLVAYLVGCVACLILMFLKLPEMFDFVSQIIMEQTL